MHGGCKTENLCFESMAMAKGGVYATTTSLLPSATKTFIITLFNGKLSFGL